ncbi:hypothetical protein AB0I94_36250 [Streptomyces sp. NPDC050147]|uniref:hypothetical protein n=1 Tax=Streptomyces sp. NPDC050147 TaxID=3155513 RepID=UPI00341AC0F4
MVETLIGVGAGLLGAAIGAWAALRARIPVKARVEVVDLAVLYPDADADSGDQDADDIRQWLAACHGIPPVGLDVKLRNSGGQSAYVTELSLELSDVLYEAPPELTVLHLVPMSTQPSNGTYNVILGSPGSGRDGEVLHTKRQRISHVLPPGGVDRFVVLVDELPERPRSYLAWFRLRAILTYNAIETVTSPQAVCSPLRRPPRFWSPDEFVAQMQEALREIDDDPRSLQPSVRRCVSDYEQHLLRIRTAYVESRQAASGDSPEEPPALQECLNALPLIRQELGLA